MTGKPRAAVSWSGGKDSCTAFEWVKNELDVVAALTMIDLEGTRSRAHGIRTDLLRRQTEALGLHHVMRRCEWSSYEEEFEQGLRELAELGVTHVISGDIIEAEHRQWTESIAKRAGLVAVEPLWGQPTLNVVQSFLQMGGEALIVALREGSLEPSWLGAAISPELIEYCIAHGIDACGEDGSYHTFVTHSPSFREKVHVRPGVVVQMRGYWAVDLEFGLPPQHERMLVKG